ncbi:MAG: NUDIX hydrolase [Prosthecobacter sp.]|nr:NUDIX hydrolase [Prosthecobacter sp.]
MVLPVPYFPLFEPGREAGWSLESCKRVFDHPHISVERAEFLTPHRRDQPVPWMVVHRKAAVAIAPVLADGRFVMISQERLPVQQTCLEFPAGQVDEEAPLDQPDCSREIIAATALRELREEAGLELHPTLGRLEPLGWFLPSQGFTNEHVYLFKAEPVCVVSRPEPDGSEHISDVRFVSAEELRRMIAENEVTTALTLALYARMAAKGSLPGV